MAHRLKDKVALVFGAGSGGPGWGNGKATAVSFARHGARVACVDLNLEAAGETRDIITKEGGEAVAMAADVTRSADIAETVERTISLFGGRIDILHNNVGIASTGGPTEETEEGWRRVLDTNLTSVFLTCKHVLPVMLRQGKGAIVNVSSLAGIRYAYNYVAYSASKAALNHLTVSVALEHAKAGIRCNAILPGLMDTPMIYNQISSHYASVDDMVAARNAMAPMGRMGTAWDVANAAVFLASDEAAYITGVCLRVDGGLACKVG